MIKSGDYITRNSYKNDTLFLVLSVKGNMVYLKGVNDRLYADSPVDDCTIVDKEVIEDKFNVPKVDTDEIINKIVDGILKDDKVKSKISNLQNIITQNRLQIKNQYIMKTKGDITLEQFLKFKEEKDNLIEKSEKIIEQLNVKYDKDSLIKLVKEKYESFTEDEEVFNIVVKELIEKIILYRDRTIKINFKFKKLDSYSIKLY